MRKKIRVSQPISVAVSFAILMSAAIALMLGCGGKGGGSSTGSGAEPGAIEMNSGVIPPTGGTVSLNGIGSVTFDPNSFSGQTVVIAKREDAATAQLFTDTSLIFDPDAPAGYQVAVNTGNALPTSDSFTVTLNLAPSFVSSLPASHSPEAFALMRQTTEDGEILDGWELIPSTYDPQLQTLVIQVDTGLLSKYFSPNNTYRLLLMIAPTPGPHSQLRPLAGPDPGICEATNIGDPLDSMQVLTPYGKLRKDAGGFYKLHYGADLAAAIGTPVKAAGTGKLYIYPNVSGYGKTIVVRHQPGSVSTLYAHLSDFKKADGTAWTTGASVTEGDVIGHTGITGNAAGTTPHLHFELAPSGDIFARKNKVNPLACTGNTADGDLRAGDNGSLADDQFSVYLTPVDRDGNPTGPRTFMFQTALGGYGQKAVSGLRIGEYLLELVCDVAPDDVGTYEIQLSGNLVFKTGDSTYRTGVLTQGAELQETIEVFSSTSTFHPRPSSRPNPIREKP